MGQLNGALRVFCPQRGRAISPKSLQEEELFLPMWPRNCFSPYDSDGAAQFLVSALLPHRNIAKPTGMTLVMVQTSKTSDFALCCLLKLVVIYPPLLFPINGFRKSFSCGITCACFHSLSLFLPCSSLCDQGSFPLKALVAPFLPKWTLCSSYLLWGGHFSTCVCAVLFSQLSDQFLGYSQ